MPRNKIVVRADDGLFCHCQCEGALATQGQMDCPWCGCGWMFACTQCNRAFTFGKVVESDLSELELAQQLISSDAPEDAEYAQDAWAWYREELEHLQPGQRVVFLDGAIRAVESAVAFNGWFARHEFDQLPQAVAQSKEELDNVLGDKNYWFKREITDPEPG